MFGLDLQRETQSAILQIQIDHRCAFTQGVVQRQRQIRRKVVTPTPPERLVSE